MVVFGIVSMAQGRELSFRGAKRRGNLGKASPSCTGQCRGADSRARRRTCSPYKPPLKWQTLPNCHCEEANGRRGNLAVPCWIIGQPRRIRKLLFSLWREHRFFTKKQPLHCAAAAVIFSFTSCRRYGRPHRRGRARYKRARSDGHRQRRHRGRHRDVPPSRPSRPRAQR